MRYKSVSKIRSISVGCVIACVGLSEGRATEQPKDFYEKKAINLYVGFSPGGSYDFYARLFARHMGRYIPGNPLIVVQTMGGAGSLQAANFLFNVAPKDGTALGVVTQTLMLEEAMNSPGVKYKSSDFHWIGRMTAVLETMIISGNAKAKTIEDVTLFETTTAGTGPGSPSEGYPRLLNAFAGTKYKVISGYQSSAHAMVALEAGEVDSLEVSYNTIVRTKADWLKSGKIKVIAQAALERSPDLPDVPTLVELGQTARAKASLAFYTSAAAVSRSIIATPGIPEERVRALRNAFNAVQKDPDFLVEIAKTNSEFDPASGEYLQELALKIAATPQDIIADTSSALRER